MHEGGRNETMGPGSPLPGISMIASTLADGVVLLHFGFILFVVFGGFLLLCRKWVAALHLPAVLWAAAIEFRRGICPLTPLEQELRRAAGATGYSGSFIEHYLIPIIYPAGLDERLQYVLGTLVIVINLAVYGWVLFRLRQGSGRRYSESSS
jgi:hypothetical protein